METKQEEEYYWHNTAYRCVGKQQSWDARAEMNTRQSFKDYKTKFQGYKNTVSILKLALEVINNNTDIGK